MKRKNSSFPIIIALTIVCLILSNKVSLIGRATVITSCFTNVTVSGISGLSTTTPIYNITNCSSARALFIEGVVYLQSIDSDSRSDCFENTDKFCCIEFTEINNPNDPFYAAIPFIDPDGVSGPLPNSKYFIQLQTNIRCMISQ